MAKAKNLLSGYKTYDTAKGFGNTRQWQQAFHTRMSTEEAQRILQQQSDSPYSILGITEQATESIIKKAYRKLLHQWHPDKNADNVVQAEAMTKKIIAAYSFLINK